MPRHFEHQSNILTGARIELCLSPPRKPNRMIRPGSGSASSGKFAPAGHRSLESEILAQPLFNQSQLGRMNLPNPSPQS